MLYSEIYDERNLLQRVAEGDEFAFSKLFQKYHQLLGHHIFRLTESRELAEEIVQDVFLKIWMIRESLSEVADFRSWVFTISKNQALNALRHTARQRVLHVQWEKDMTASSGTSELHVYWLSIVDEAIDQLPQQQKKVYLLSRTEGMSYHEIAGKLDLSHETVKYYMKLALASITKHVKEKAGLAILLLAFTYY